MASTTTKTCYRHSDRETGVSCSNCGRPICTECMTSTPVGMRCPECSKQRTQVRTLGSLTPDPDLTKVLIALSVLAFAGDLLTGGSGTRASGELYQYGALNRFVVGEGEWWRLVTSGFLHSGVFHLLLNMVGLFFLGQILEPVLGRLRFGLLYVASLLAGSLGVLLLEPTSTAVGASGAIFGLLGAAFVISRARGDQQLQSLIGIVLVLNLLLTFRPGISIGAHLGGLAAGLLLGWVFSEWGDRRATRWVPVGAAVAICVVAFAAAIIASGTPSLY